MIGYIEFWKGRRDEKTRRSYAKRNEINQGFVWWDFVLMKTWLR
jgi:hypothetical protein